MSAVGVNYSWGMDFSQEGAVVFRLESAAQVKELSVKLRRRSRAFLK